MRKQVYFRRWYLAGIPELELFPSDELRESAVEKLEESVGFNMDANRYWIYLVIAVIVIGVILPRLLPRPGWLRDEFVDGPFPLAMLAVGLYFGYRMRRRAAVFLRRELIQCGVPICLCCGYYLRGLGEGRCPECGTPFDEKIAKLIEQDAARQPGVDKGAT